MTIEYSWKHVLVEALVTSLIALFLLSYNIGSIPHGLFTDEAEIGVTAYNLIHGKDAGLINVFYYQHLEYVLGALPVYATVPFIKIFGLSEESLRFASVFYAAMTAGVLVLIGHFLKLKMPWIAALLFVVTPMFYHVARTNFGHTSALLACAIGYYFYLISKNKKGLPIQACIAGVFFGLALYGQASFVIGVPLLMVSLWGAQLITSISLKSFRLQQFVPVILSTGLCMIFLLPMLHQLAFNTELSKRFVEKGDQADKSIIRQVITQYPKYYNPQWWFTKGETGMTTTGILRHSVTGSGEVYFHTGVLLILGLICVAFMKSHMREAVLPMYLFLVLFPIPDALTTRPDAPAYVYSAFIVMLSLGIVILCGMDVLIQTLRYLFAYKDVLVRFGSRVLLVLIVVFVSSEMLQFAHNYRAYPATSSGYWGWQWGYKDIIGYYKEVADQYDQVYIHGNANAPLVFLDFYDPTHVCTQCVYGGYDKLDLTQKQLMSLTPDEHSNAVGAYPDVIFITKKTLTYPDGSIAFYIVQPHEKTD